jgi:hypothetical protein
MLAYIGSLVPSFFFVSWPPKGELLPLPYTSNIMYCLTTGAKAMELNHELKLL